MLCERCSRLRVDDIVEQDVAFHPNLLSLQSSAAHGCAFCALCWSTLQSSVHRRPLDCLLRGESAWAEGEAWTPTLFLRGSNFDDAGSAGARIYVSCGHSIPLYIDGRRDANTNPSGGVFGHLEVYEQPGRPSRYRLAGRRTTAACHPGLYLDLIRKWWHGCCAHHTACRADADDADGGSAMPTRVLDLGDSTAAGKPPPRLLPTEGRLQAPYVALSYCWGRDSSPIPVLTVNTYDDLLRGRVPERAFAQTHRETMALARALGIRYMWIDALCILQGDTADWERESRTMVHVYRNAALTVVAGRAANARDGFVTNALDGQPGRVPPCEMRVMRVDAGTDETLMVDLPRAPDVGPVASRAWCFQEGLLSRRAVVFGQQQLSFRCITASVLENGHRSTPSLSAMLLRPLAATTDTEHRDRVLQTWYNLVRLYTRCRLTEPSDIFAALMGVAQCLAPAIGSRYLAGLWEGDLVRGLCWQPSDQLESPMPGLATRPTTRPSCVRAPSWSWAAVDGFVSQESFSPPSVAKYRRRDFSRVRPRATGWTRDTCCHVAAVHMPACVLQLVGRVGPALVVPQRLAAYGRASAHWPDRWKRSPNVPKRWDDHGVLLAQSPPATTATAETAETAETADPWRRMVAAAFFDVQHERHGLGTVWCLLLTEERGLVLQRTSDHAGHSFRRLGWFEPLRTNWPPVQAETEVHLY